MHVYKKNQICICTDLVQVRGNILVQVALRYFNLLIEDLCNCRLDRAGWDREADAVGIRI
jgi:hypothetical protein